MRGKMGSPMHTAILGGGDPGRRKGNHLVLTPSRQEMGRLWLKWRGVEREMRMSQARVKGRLQTPVKRYMSTERGLGLGSRK